VDLSKKTGIKNIKDIIIWKIKKIKEAIKYITDNSRILRIVLKLKSFKVETIFTPTIPIDKNTVNIKEINVMVGDIIVTKLNIRIIIKKLKPIKGIFKEFLKSIISNHIIILIYI
jgi:hypothetical protein